MMTAKHRLESKYGLSAWELMDSIDSRFRLRVALEGAVAEVQMAKKIAAIDRSVVEKFEIHDLDGHPDFSIWLPGRKPPLFAECKNVRESTKVGGEAYRLSRNIVAYKVETQKTRAATGDPTSRYYDIGQYNILGVCLGKKTGDWSDFLFVRTIDLECHAKHSHKLAVMQRVPLPDAGRRHRDSICHRGRPRSCSGFPCQMRGAFVRGMLVWLSYFNILTTRHVAEAALSDGAWEGVSRR